MRLAPATLLLLVLLFLCAGCDRDVVEPALAAGDDAALLKAAGLGELDGRHTLGSLVVEATTSVRRARGDAAVDELLDPLLRRQAAARALEAEGDPAQLASARQAVREAEVAIALEVLGPARVERVLSGATRDLAAAAAALDTALAAGRDVAGLREQQVQVEQGLAAARLALADSALAAALDAGTRAAEQLVRLRRALLDLDRVAGLPELFARAERRLATSNGDYPGGTAMLLRHAELRAAAGEAVTDRSREAAHAALSAVREEELRIVLQVLGPDCAATVVADVGSALEQLEKATRPQESRLRRMLAAATDLHVRAARALDAGDAVVALDLGSYAAGLVNAYRLALTRF